MVKVSKKASSAKEGNAAHIQPMLCTLVTEPLQSDEYIYEQKWDGYRIIAHVDGKNVRMYSRSGLDYTSRYPLIAEALTSLGHDCVIDGEVVVFNQQGEADFDSLQLYNGKRSPISYCVFDLLELDGKNLMELPLLQRKELLEALTRGHATLRFSESFTDGEALFKKAMDDNLEGIVGKVRDSPYVPGNRSSLWIKIPTRKRQEFVIGGWAESDKSRSFRSLLFGAYENGKFTWIGRSGGGYKQSEMPGILAKLQKIETETSPFVNRVLDTKGAKIHWVKPRLVANFEFATWTKSGRIRKPATFLGFRSDKKPKDVVREVPKTVEAVEQQIEPDLEKSIDNEPDNPALEQYRDKRKFDRTPEPSGGSPDQNDLIFVVQKHDASHLHYDFRLEMRGVLKSWAVPKGPSMNPSDHRLAMAVEDHPFDYKDFEGIIPQGQYGGGTVIVWDTGTYEPGDRMKGKKAREHWLLSHYYNGAITIRLQGKKLKGLFNIIRMPERGDNAWLLTKVEDGHELSRDVLRKDRSVLSGMTITEMSLNKQASVWQSNRGGGNSDELITANEVERTSDQPAHKLVRGLFPRKRLSEHSNWKKILDEKVSSEGVVEVDGEKVTFTNIEKHLWKSTTKADLIAYYNNISSYILPHLKDRPLSLHIKNIAAQVEGYYVKDMEGMVPPFVDVFSTKRKHEAEGKRSVIDYPVCNSLASLLWLVNLGCIDMNPWNSRTVSPLTPDYITVDLDPSDNDFGKAIATAKAAKGWFNKHKLKTFIKTSGKTGMHIFIPCSGFTYPQARVLSKYICIQIHELVPDITTIEVSKDHRGDKLFVDFSQNDEADTLAAAYSVRPGPLPLVSTPLEWREVKAGLEPGKFTIKSMLKRISDKGELWENIINPNIQQANSKILRRIINKL